MNPALTLFVNSPVWAALLGRVFLPRLLTALPSTPRRILEIGCGRGDTTRLLLARFPSSEIDATDYDAAQVTRAAARVRDTRARIARADATALPFADAAFDLVVEFNTFHHVADWRAAIRECARVLAPGGTFGVMDETSALFNPVFRFIDRPESLFTKEEFFAAAKDAGLSLRADLGSKRVIRATWQKA